MALPSATQIAKMNRSGHFDPAGIVRPIWMPTSRGSIRCDARLLREVRNIATERYLSAVNAQRHAGLGLPQFVPTGAASGIALSRESGAFRLNLMQDFDSAPEQQFDRYAQDLAP